MVGFIKWYGLRIVIFTFVEFPCELLFVYLRFQKSTSVRNLLRVQRRDVRAQQLSCIPEM